MNADSDPTEAWKAKRPRWTYDKDESADVTYARQKDGASTYYADKKADSKWEDTWESKEDTAAKSSSSLESTTYPTAPAAAPPDDSYDGAYTEGSWGAAANSDTAVDEGDLWRDWKKSDARQRGQKTTKDLASKGKAKGKKGSYKPKGTDVRTKYGW